MRPAVAFYKSSPSSSRWLARQSKDPYVRLRVPSTSSPPSSPSAFASPSPLSKGSGPPAYRSRSSFKLVSLAAKHPILSHGTKSIVDLGAAPGGWSQVAAHLLKINNRHGQDDGGVSVGQHDHGRTGGDLREIGHGSDIGQLRNGYGLGRVGQKRIIAVDILAMDPIQGVEVIQGDFLEEAVRQHVQALANGDGDNDVHSFRGIDTVLSDMMAPMSGNRTRDTSLSLQLCSAALVFARDVLRQARSDEVVRKEAGKKKMYPGGNLVMKFFAHPDLDEFKKLELDPWFGKVLVEKPKESRSESSEAYFVCLGYKGDPATR